VGRASRGVMVCSHLNYAVCCERGPPWSQTSIIVSHKQTHTQTHTHTETSLQ